MALYYQHLKTILKKLCIVVAIVCMYTNANSQSKLYFDDSWHETTKEKAHYYRIVVKKKDGLFHIKDYYINNVLQMDGHFTNLEKETMTGLMTFYDKKGNVEATRNYNAKGVLHGLSTFYLKNGTIAYTTDFRDGDVYDGIYKTAGGYREYHHNKGKMVMMKENAKYGPNEFTPEETRIYGKTVDTVYWRNFEGQLMGIGTYKSREYTIINGVHARMIGLRILYTNHVNGKREGLQKMFFEKLLVSEDTFTNDSIIKSKSVHPITHKKFDCDFKNEKPYNGTVFIYDFINNVEDECIEYHYKNGEERKQNTYSGKKGIYTLVKP